MEIHINRKFLKKREVDIEAMLRKIATGKAILFTGAGFSVGTRNVDNEEPPIASKLSKAICNLGGFSEDEDLRYSSDYYIESGFDKAKLIRLLKQCYTLQSVGDAQKNICIPAWRRFYTTNYDKGIEMASSNIGRVVECIDLDKPTTEYYKRDHLCVHLNGSIDSLPSGSLENKFKLSTSSYVSADSFILSDWYYYFKKDLERSSAIVFVGYSMYDIEIQKVLFEGSNLKEKTYFITSKEQDLKLEFILSKFGHFLPIGVDGFSELISNHIDLFNQESAENDLQSLCEYELSDDSRKITDFDVESLLMYGDIGDAFVDNAVAGQQRIPYLILREALDKILEFTEKSQNTLIYSGLGNGKSIILRQLKSFLTLNAIRVFSVNDTDGDYISDLDMLAKLNDKIAIIIDNYEAHLDLIRHYSLSNPKNICIISASRTADHERLRAELREIGFQYREIGVDELSYDEASYFVSIIDNVGMWGSSAGLTHERKLDLLRKKNSMQISLSLLDLFNAPQIKKRIDELVRELFLNRDYKRTVFSIAFLEVLDIPARPSLISEVAGDNNIYSSQLLESLSFRHLFKIAGSRVHSKSSLFSLFLIRTSFTPDYITGELRRIAEKFNKYSNKDYIQEKIFKATLRFSFIERLLPDMNKKNNLRNYYENLKVTVPWLKRDPHFWLQYGMSNIPFKEYGKAQLFIDQAYSFAKNKDNYYVTNIDTQQARLLILMAISETDNAKIYPMFEEAHKLLFKINDDAYKYRQVEKYYDFYEACNHKLSSKNRARFISACKLILDQIDVAENNRKIDAQHNYAIKVTKEKLERIIRSANA